MKKIFVCLWLIFLASCSPSPHSQIFYAFGTQVTVQIEGISSEKAEHLFSQIDEKLKHMHQRWHAWQDSELSDIRKACLSGAAIEISDDVAYLIKEGQLLEKQSLGYFNPAIGELLDLWGFLSHTSTQSRSAPTHEAIAQVLAYHPSMQDFVLQGNHLTCSNPHVRLDFGAYAKGYGVGQIMTYLKSEGVTQAMINAGGDVMILQSSTHLPKRIAIQSPIHNNPEMVLSISQSTTVFTSGTYARNFTDPQTQQKFHHLINPKTGYPSTDFISVTVMHPDPVRADAAATALLASDKESWLAVAHSMEIEKYLLITVEGEKMGSLLPSPQ